MIWMIWYEDIFFQFRYNEIDVVHFKTFIICYWFVLMGIKYDIIAV